VADPDHVVGPGQPLRLDGSRQLGESGAFLEEHGVVEHLARFEQAQHGEGIGPLRHLVLAGPEGSRPSLDEGEEGKAEGTSDDVGLVEASRDVEHTEVRWNLDDARARGHRGGGGDQPPDLEADEEAAEDHHAPHELAQRSAGVSRGAGRALEEPGPFHHDFL